MLGTRSVLGSAGKVQNWIIFSSTGVKISTLKFHVRFLSDSSFSTLHRWPKHQFAKHHSASMTGNKNWMIACICEHLYLSVIMWSDSFKCILLYNRDKEKGYNRRLIWYSYLVLGTRSAAKFEKVPSTSLHRVIVRCHAQSTRGPCISSDTKMLRYLWCNPDLIDNLRSNVLHTGCSF